MNAEQIREQQRVRAFDTQAWIQFEIAAQLAELNEKVADYFQILDLDPAEIEPKRGIK